MLKIYGGFFIYKLQLKHVYKYFGNQKVLDDISLNFPSKGLVSIIGKSGSGKSTLLNILSGLLSPDSGTVLYKGKDISDFKGNNLSSFRSKEIGIIFQHYNLLENLSGYENIKIAAELGRLRRKIFKTKLNNLSENLQITSLIYKQSSNLSGGEKQRIAIARTLINNPEIILADEPTGALDINNAKIVMDKLKELSKQKLIILVSHNLDLIKNYSDEILELHNGKLINKINSDKIVNTAKKPVKPKSNWILRLLRKHLKEDKKMNLLLIISIIVSFSSLLITLGFYNGSNQSFLELRSSSLLYHTAYISEKTYIELEDSPLKLVKQSRPKMENAIDAFSNTGDITICSDLAYFIPSYTSFYLNDNLNKPCEFSPIYDTTLSEFGSDLITDGFASNANYFNEVLVNKEFVNEYNGKVNDIISVNADCSIGNETINLNFNFVIKCVVNEFSFLNNPRIYYSYQGAKEYLSSFMYNDTSLMSILDDSSSDSPYSCYRYLVYVHREKYASAFYDLIEKINTSHPFLYVDSSCYEISNSFLELTNSFLTALLIFVIIAIILTCLIIGFISYSNFIKRKKESAILSCLGSIDKDLEDLYCFESIIVSLIGSFIVIPFSIILENIFNNFLYNKFNLKNLIDIPFYEFLNFKYLVPLLTCIFAIIIGFIGSFMPLKNIRKFDLIKELKDE